MSIDKILNEAIENKFMLLCILSVLISKGSLHCIYKELRQRKLILHWTHMYTCFGENIKMYKKTTLKDYGQVGFWYYAFYASLALIFIFFNLSSIFKEPLFFDKVG
jgi:hypothetical protein